MIIPPRRPIGSASTSRREAAASNIQSEPIDRYTPERRPNPPASPATGARPGNFWKGAALGAGLAALGCLAVGATGPLGWMIAGCAALVGGVHHRDSGISQEKLQQLEDWNRRLQEP